MENSIIVVNDDTPAFMTWFSTCQDKRAQYDVVNFPNNPKEELVAEFGSRYVKISKVRPNPQDPKHPLSCSVWAFIDRLNGDVLKPSSWRAPAKGARGNIFDVKNGLGMVGPYGPGYLRSGVTGDAFA